MEVVGIVIMVVMMGAILLFGHKAMMGGHGGHAHDAEAKTPVSAAVTNAVTNAPAESDHHQH